MAIRIVVDVMGVDHPPEELVTGALAAAERLPIHLILAGRRRLIEPHLPEDAHAEVLDCEEFVPQDAPPVRAIRMKGTSILRGLELVAQGKAEAFLSPGNTGAVVAAALLVLGRIPGIKRPGICASIPTLKGKELLLIDAGATADPKPEHLLQFADMGRLYAQEVLGIPEPKLGLLSIGEETIKGDKLVRTTHRLLSERPDFVGNVEPHALLTQRPVDLVVSGGFAGNLTIKALEGGAEATWSALRDELRGSIRSRAGATLLRPTLRNLVHKMRYDRYNGAPLLGVQGLVMVAHGRSSSSAMEAAVERTFWAAKAELVGRVTSKLSHGA